MPYTRMAIPLRSIATGERHVRQLKTRLTMNLESIKNDKSDISLNLENFDDDKSDISIAAVILGITIFIVFCIGVVWGWKFAVSIFG
jgi:hypothetical protein